MVEEIVARLTQDGYATVPGALEPDQVAAARADLEAILERTPSGRDDFEGRRTQRVYALFAKTRTLDPLAIHPVVLAVLDRVLGHASRSARARPRSRCTPTTRSTRCRVRTPSSSST